MAKEGNLESNQIEDISWLCCLTESELDLLITLKTMIFQRAKLINRESLAKKFDLELLRALGFILMDSFKGNIKDWSNIPCLEEVFSSLDALNLLKQNHESDSSILSTEEVRTLIGAH